MRFWKIWDKMGIYIICIAVLIVFGLLTPIIFSEISLNNILVSAASVAIAAIGMTLAIVSGGFDLSVGSIMAMTTCIVGIAALDLQLDLVWCLVLAMGAALLVGFINGLIISKLRIQAFIATLTMQVIVKGIAYLVTNGNNVYFISAGDAKIISTGRWMEIPIPIWLVIIAYIIAIFIYKKTTIGVYIRSVGSNSTAASLSGVKVDKTIIGVYMTTALCACVAGIIAVSQTLNGNAGYGADLPLNCIAAAVLGGASLRGGKANLIGTLVAAILLSIIGTGLNLLNVSTHYQDIVTGLILVVVLFVSGLDNSISGKSKERVYSQSVRGGIK